MLKLVKDFSEYKIIYYWIDASQACISPEFPTLAHAKEWFIHFHFRQHTGTDRRKRRVDRRRSQHKTPERGFSKRNAIKQGRRITDRPIQIDIDLAREKLDSLLQSAEDSLSVQTSNSQ